MDKKFYKKIELSEKIKALLDDKKYGLISNFMREFIGPIMEEEDPTPELLQSVNEKALVAVNYIFKGVTTCEIRKEGNKTFYKILQDNVMIFEYGIEEV